MRLAPTLALALVCASISIPLAASSGTKCNLNDNTMICQDPRVQLPGRGRGGAGGLRGDDPAQVRSWIETYNIKGLSPEHWAAGHILNMVDSGVLAIREGDVVDPDAPAMAYQASRVALRFLGENLDGLSNQQIADRAVAGGLLADPATGHDRKLTRLEAALMAAHLTGYQQPVLPLVDMSTVYQDWSAVPEAYRNQVYWVTIQNRLFVGFSDHTFRPAADFSLGQFAALVERLQASPR